MGRGTALIGLLVVLAVGGYFYKDQLEQVMPGGVAPTTGISVTGVRNDLLAMANSEKRYLISHPKYATIEELRADGDIHVPTRPDFKYSIEADDSHFVITATYTGTDPRAPKHLTVDETLSITSK